MNKSYIVFILFAFVLTGCGNDQESSSETANAEQSSARQSMVDRSGSDRPEPDQAVEEDQDVPLISAPRLKGQSEVEGQGLEMVIYASDRREYQESLRLIAEQTSDRQFQQLDAALRYLMINDPSIMNNEQLLFQFINGKTGMEIMRATADLVAERSGE